MTKPLALFLADFGRPALPLPGLPSFGGDDDILELQAGPDLDEQLAEARGQGHAEGEAAGRAAADAEIAALGASHEAHVEALRNAWIAEQGEALAGLIRDGLRDVETAIADALAAVLEPVLADGMRAKALDEVRDAIGTLLAGDRGAVVRVTGPADLVDAVQAALGPAPGVDFAADATAVELTVLAGDTTVRSVLEPWAERLRASIGEDQ